MKSCPNCKQQEVKPLTSKQLGLYLLSNTTSASFCSSFTQTALLQAHSSHAHAHCDNVSLDQLIFHHMKCGQLMAKLSHPVILCKAKEEWYLMPAWLLVPDHKEMQVFPPVFSCLMGVPEQRGLEKLPYPYLDAACHSSQCRQSFPSGKSQKSYCCPSPVL